MFGRGSVRRGRFTRDAAVFVPRRCYGQGDPDLDRFMAEVNETVERRGIVLADGQVVKTPFDERLGYELYGDDSAFDAPPRRPWGSAQREFFGLENPYQMDEEPDGFLGWHVRAFVAEPFLAANESIAGLVHGEADGSAFACECHEATVVYTTLHRLVCMSCGYTHRVLREAIDVPVATLLSAEDWVDLFDPGGKRRHEEVDLAIVDFRQVEDAASTWDTDRWTSSSREFVFFARTPPGELAAAIEGTQLDPSVLADAGFEPVELPPTPALQLSESSVDVDLVANAGHAFRDGVTAYLAAYTRPDELVHAILHLFRAIELLLKARLAEAEPDALEKRLTNPAVLERLRELGVRLPASDLATIAQLRQLRNRLQHGGAAFNHRAGLALCRRAIVFVDAFAGSELGLDSSGIVEREAWQD